METKDGASFEKPDTHKEGRKFCQEKKNILDTLRQIRGFSFLLFSFSLLEADTTCPLSSSFSLNEVNKSGTPSSSARR